MSFTPNPVFLMNIIELSNELHILNEHHVNRALFPRALQSLHAHKLRQVIHHNSKSSTLIFENVPIKKE